jgi:hypothetical protein
MCPRLISKQLYNQAYNRISGVTHLLSIFAVILPLVPFIVWIWASSELPYIGTVWLL